MDKSQARIDIQNNRHNQHTCVYYLLLLKHVKRGHSSIADFVSKEYTDYLSNPKSLIKNRPIAETGSAANEDKKYFDSVKKRT